jgi:signal transduction histidine kinase
VQQLKENEERQRISSELHDDMGSTLTKIAMMGRAIQLDPEENKSLLPRVTTSADRMVNQMNEIIWALNVRNDTLENLLAFIRKYASEFLEEGKYSLQFEEPDHIPDVALSGEVRRNIFLVVKEALHNIEKHSEAKCVKLQIALNGELVISIADDGRGISSEKKNVFGNGMINMKQRMKQIHGDLEIISPLENYRGTKIEISFPLQ